MLGFILLYTHFSFIVFPREKKGERKGVKRGRAGRGEEKRKIFPWKLFRYFSSSTFFPPLQGFKHSSYKVKTGCGSSNLFRLPRFSKDMKGKSRLMLRRMVEKNTGYLKQMCDLLWWFTDLSSKWWSFQLLSAVKHQEKYSWSFYEDRNPTLPSSTPAPSRPCHPLSLIHRPVLITASSSLSSIVGKTRSFKCHGK